ncbi:hypothetical protein OAT67_05745 [Bacteriovoracaceae bacterium]|nr:hypothetical protein [Bacteriovoracaceae bacterium]
MWSNKFEYAKGMVEANMLHPILENKNLITHPLVAVLAHELGHVYGFKHTHREINLRQELNYNELNIKRMEWLDGYVTNVMDESFPAMVLKEGGIPNTVFTNSLTLFGKGPNKLIASKTKSKMQIKNFRIAVKIKSITSKNMNDLGIVYKEIGEILQNKHSILFEVSNENFRVSTLQLNQRLYTCIPEFDYPTEKFKTLSDCRKFHQEHSEEEFKFKREILSESKPNILSFNSRIQNGVEFGILEIGETFERLNKLPIIPFYEQSFYFKTKISEKNFLFELKLDKGGHSPRLLVTESESMNVFEVNLEGITFLDFNSLGSSIPSLF